MDTSIQRLLKMKKNIFGINSHIPIENNLMKTVIDPSIYKITVKIQNFFWLFGFLSWLLIIQLMFLSPTLNGQVYILETVLDMFWTNLQTYSRFQKSFWMFETEWNPHRIGILNNLLDWQPHQHLSNTSTWSKKEQYYIWLILITLYTSKETSP